MRIAKVEAWPVLLPLKGTFVSSHGSRATTARTVVRVTADDGAIGHGETIDPDKLRFYAERYAEEDPTG